MCGSANEVNIHIPWGGEPQEFTVYTMTSMVAMLQVVARLQIG